MDPLKETDLKARAESFLRTADLIGCKKFINANDIITVSLRNLTFVFITFTNSFLAFQAKKELVKVIKKASGENEVLIFL